MPIPSKLRIAIVGAGPGGLTLARVLHLHGVEALLFEKERAPSDRSQGGSLDMHVDSGQFAVEVAGLGSEFKAIARYGDQESRIYDKHGNLIFIDTKVEGKDRPEVDRGQLRQMLIDSVPSGTVRWNHALEAVIPASDGTSELLFQNGTKGQFDLVVGADGAWSRVRPILSKAQPLYSGVTFMEMGIDDVDQRHPALARMAGRGLTFALGDSKALVSHRDANAHLGIYAALRCPDDWIRKGGLDTSSPSAAKASLAGHFSGWSDSLLEFIRQSGDKMTPRAIYGLEPGHSWEHRRGITLLGDAAHLMSPFGGDGANLAMLDAAELGRILVLEENFDDAVRVWESAVASRAAPPAISAWMALDDVFGEEGLAHMVRTMQSHTT
jgi:2-polyprenyl-6-methoxyphenol hydroxylase-like FAD-dependent oxidoreductase